MQNLRIQKRSNGVFLVCDRGQVAHMTAGYGPTQEEDAAFIVRACANHAALLEALKELVAELDNPDLHDQNIPETGGMILARQAISKATGKELI